MQGQYTKFCKNLGSATLKTALLTTLGLSVPLLGSLKPGIAAPVTAQSADAFVNSIGIGLHLHYTDTNYNNFSGLVQPALRTLGVRYARDGAYSPTQVDPNYYPRCRALAADGIRFNLVANRRINSAGHLELTTNPAELGDIYQACNGAVVSFEAWNEPDISGVSSWVQDSLSAQQQLYNGIKGNPLISHVPFLTPSLGRSLNAPLLGNLDAVSNYGNMHIYFSGFHPETNGYGGSFHCNNQDFYYGSVDYNLNCVSYTVSPSHPGIATETGFNNFVTPGNGGGTPESITARYLTRTLLHHFNRGIKRTYLYELLDEKPDPYLKDPEQHYGLVRVDGTPKPAFTALQNLISLLSEPGSSFTPSTLDYTLTGNTANIHRTLLQKKNGEFYLALWLGLSSWDPNAPCQYTDSSQIANNCVEARQRFVTPQSVSLTVPSNYTVLKYDWRSTDGAMSSVKISTQGGTINFNATDDLTIFRLVPNATQSPPSKDCLNKNRKTCFVERLQNMLEILL